MEIIDDHNCISMTCVMPKYFFSESISTMLSFIQISPPPPTFFLQEIVSISDHLQRIVPFNLYGYYFYHFTFACFLWDFFFFLPFHTNPFISLYIYVYVYVAFFYFFFFQLSLLLLAESVSPHQCLLFDSRFTFHYPYLSFPYSNESSTNTFICKIFDVPFS